MTIPPRPRTDRRQFLSGTAAATFGLLAGANVVLSACTSSPQATVKRATPLSLPEYAPRNIVDPDLPSDKTARVTPIYFTFPSTFVSTTTGTAGAGGTITALMPLVANPPPPPIERNLHWREINKAVHATIKFQLADSATYPEKFATVIAGGELPDVANIPQQPHLPDLLLSKFADLSPYLAGAAVKDYPNLANIPTNAWKSVVYNNAIYGVPLPRSQLKSALVIRSDIAKDVGIDHSAVEDGAGFLAMCKELTDPRANRWAAGDPSTILLQVQSMVGAPNVWREDGGKFTSAFVTDEARRALDIVSKMWRDGLFHPDSFASPDLVSDWLGTGRTVLSYTGADPAYIAFNNRKANPAVDFRFVTAPKWDGGGAASQPLDPGYLGIFTAVRKAEPERLKEILRVLNWMAAPFGSTEYMLSNWGVEGVHWNLEDGLLVQTSQGSAETVESYYLAAPPAIYVPPDKSTQDIYRSRHAWQLSIAPTAAANPAIGLYSDTDQSSGATLSTTLTDLQLEVIQGRKSLTDWDEAVATWRRNGGDKITKEYEAALSDVG